MDIPTPERFSLTHTVILPVGMTPAFTPDLRALGPDQEGELNEFNLF